MFITKKSKFKQQLNKVVPVEEAAQAQSSGEPKSNPASRPTSPPEEDPTATSPKEMGMIHTDVSHLVTASGVAGLTEKRNSNNINLQEILSPEDLDEVRSTSGMSSYSEMGAMKDYQNTLDMICQAAMDPVVIADEFGKIKSVNNEMLSLFGYSLWEVAGKNVNLLMLPEHAKKHKHFLERYRVTKVKRIIGQVRTGVQGVTKEGERISLKLKVQAITDVHGTVYIAVLKDVGRDEELIKIKDMLSHMLPRGYEEKISTGKMIAEQYKNSSVIFTDLVNFTKYSSTAEPWEIITILNEIFESFDKICKPLEVEKIKTMGDCYMAAAGCTRVMFDSPIRILEAAFQMLEAMKRIGKFQVRIGIATGKIVAGVLKGDKLQFDIWGDTVNIAARIQGHAPIGGIRVCTNTYKQTKFMYSYQPADEIEIKGKGITKTYVCIERKEI